MFEYIVSAIEEEADVIMKNSSDTQIKSRVLYSILMEISTQIGELMRKDNKERGKK